MRPSAAPNEAAVHLSPNRRWPRTSAADTPPWSESAETTSSIVDREPALPTKPKATRPPATKETVARSAASKATPGASATRTVRKKPKRAIQPTAFEADQNSAAPASNVPSSASTARQFGDRLRALDDRADTLPAWPQNVGTAGVEELEASQPPAIAPEGELAQNAQYEPAGDSAADIEARRARVREQLTRPFKQIREIRPFFDYEPDSEQLATDRCHNLCPRPGSPACPDCEEPGPDGVAQGRLMCPECPVEIDLRDTARLVGSLNDFPTRNFPHIHYCWEATNLYSYPLYFEDHCLERYGHTRHFVLQAPVSVALFAAQFVGLPYQMTIDPIAKKRYALGWYRPGQYVPYKYYQVPWNTEAALVEAGVIAGAYFLFAPGVGP